MAEEELKYTSDYSGETTDAILEYADKLRQQTEAEDGDTVQVFDTDGNPHKVSKTELLKKSTLALPSLNDISAFVAINQAGDAVGIMSKQQVAQVLGELLLIDRYLKTTNTMLRPTNDMNDLGYGIYTFSPEAGYPQNFPVSWGRGIVVVFKTSPHLYQIVYVSTDISAAMCVRLSYDEGENWYGWKQISFT